MKYPLLHLATLIVFATVCGCRARITEPIFVVSPFQEDEHLPRAILSQVGYDLRQRDYAAARESGTDELITAYEALGFSEGSNDGDFVPNLTWACWYGHHRMIRALLSRSRESINEARCPFGPMEIREDVLTPLIVAVLANDLETVKLLLSAGASINNRPKYQGDEGFTAFETAIRMSVRLKSHGTPDRKIIDLFLSREVLASKNERALTLAAIGGDTWTLRHLLSKQEWCDRLNDRVRDSVTSPLGYSAQRLDLDMVRLLIAKGADCRAQGGEAVYRALAQQTIDPELSDRAEIDNCDDQILPIVSELVEQGASLDWVCPVTGVSVLEQAKRSGFTKCFTYIEQNISRATQQ